MNRKDQELQALAALSTLWHLLAAAKSQIDPEVWRAVGGFEAEDFCDAVETGRAHPLLTKWEQTKATLAANRPAPSLLDRSARYSTVLMVEALRHAGLGKGLARKRAAAALRHVYPEATADAIRYWQSTFPPPPDDEPRIVAALERYGGDPEQIIAWFAGLIEFALSPLAARSARRLPTFDEDTP